MKYPRYTNTAAYLAINVTDGLDAAAVARNAIDEFILSNGSGSLMYASDSWFVYAFKPGVNVSDIAEFFSMVPKYHMGMARHPYSAIVTAMLATNTGKRFLEYTTALANGIDKLMKVDTGFVRRNAMGIEDMIADARDKVVIMDTDGDNSGPNLQRPSF